MGTYNYKANLDPMNLSGAKSGKKTQADAINETVKNVLSEPETIRNSERRPMNLSGAGRGLVSPPTTLIGDEEEEEEEGFSSTAEMLKTFFGWNDKYTTEAKPRDETKGLEVTFDPPPEAHAKSVLDRKIHQSLVEQSPEIVIEDIYKPVSNKVIIQDVNTSGFLTAKNAPGKYGIEATQAALEHNIAYSNILFHHTGNRNPAMETVNGMQYPDPNRGNYQFGYQFVVGLDGKTYQAAPLTKRTNQINSKSHGVSIEDQIAMQSTDNKGVFNINTIGISVVGDGSKDMNQKQIDAVMALTDELSKTLKINPENVMGHAHMDRGKQQKVPKENARGEGFELTALWREFKGLPFKANDEWGTNKNLKQGLMVSLRPRLRPDNLGIKEKEEG